MVLEKRNARTGCINAGLLYKAREVILLRHMNNLLWDTVSSQGQKTVQEKSLPTGKNPDVNNKNYERSRKHNLCEKIERAEFV